MCQTVKLRVLLAFHSSQELTPSAPLEKLRGHLVYLLKKQMMVCNKKKIKSTNKGDACNFLKLKYFLSSGVVLKKKEVYYSPVTNIDN